MCADLAVQFSFLYAERLFYSKSTHLRGEIERETEIDRLTHKQTG